MGILDWLFGQRDEVVILEDDVLGELRYRGGYWHGDVALKNPTSTLSMTLIGDEEGPSTRARAEVKKLRKRWPKFLKKEVRKQLWDIDEECRDEDWPPREFTRDTIFETYELRGAGILVDDHSTEVTIGFDTPDPDDGHTLVLHVVDDEPSGFHMDG